MTNAQLYTLGCKCAAVSWHPKVNFKRNCLGVNGVVGITWKIYLCRIRGERGPLAWGAASTWEDTMKITSGALANKRFN